jgi:hypothetical protein
MVSYQVCREDNMFSMKSWRCWGRGLGFGARQGLGFGGRQGKQGVGICWHDIVCCRGEVREVGSGGFCLIPCQASVVVYTIA